MATKKPTKYIKPLDTHVRLLVKNLDKLCKLSAGVEVTDTSAVYALLNIIVRMLPDANCTIYSTHVDYCYKGAIDINLHFSDWDGNGWAYLEQNAIPKIIGLNGKSIAEQLKCGVLVDTWDPNTKCGLCDVSYKKDTKTTSYKNEAKRPYATKALENFIKKCSVKKTA